MKTTTEIFAERFKELREEKGISIRKLSKDLHIADAAIGRWERGLRAPSIDSLVIVADYFGVTTDYLLGLEDY